MIDVTRYGRGLLPQLQACWDAVKTAANSLDDDLPFPLSKLLDLATDALAERTFAARIKTARRSANTPGRKRSKKINRNGSTQAVDQRRKRDEYGFVYRQIEEPV